MEIQRSDFSEDLEGLDQDENAAWVDYPIDAMMIRTENRTAHEVLRRINQGQFILNPDFQRDFIWKKDRQSKLIESVLMRIPLPVFYLAENRKGQSIVVDGLQRLTTFQRFIGGKLRLALPTRPDLNNRSFSELSPKLQNRVEDCQLTIYLIDAKVPPRALLDIFERVNSGVPLTRQQMRNCLHMGSATKFLREEASTGIFREATGESLRPDTMRDREVINRFCAFQLLGMDRYKGDMDEFLAEALEEMTRTPAQDLEKLSSELRTSLKNNLTVFGRYAFRKHSPEQASRGTFNVALWDVMATGMSRLSEDIAGTQGDLVRAKFQELMHNETFLEAITFGTNQVNRVRERFRIAREAFQEVFNA